MYEEVSNHSASGIRAQIPKQPSGLGVVRDVQMAAFCHDPEA